MSVVFTQWSKQRKKKINIIAPIFSLEKNESTTQPKPDNTNRATSTSKQVVPKERKTTATTLSTSTLSSGLGISITALNKKQEEKVETIELIKGEQNERFTEDQLKAAWIKYTDGIQEEHHLRNSMLNCQPKLIEDTKFEVVVNNPMQEQKLLENRINILNRLRLDLKNLSIDMTVRISVDNEKKLAFTPAERFNLMAKENELLLKLKDEFGLELS